MKKNIQIFQSFAVENSKNIVGGKAFFASSYLTSKVLTNTPSKLYDTCEVEMVLTTDSTEPKCLGQLFKPKGN